MTPQTTATATYSTSFLAGQIHRSAYYCFFFKGVHKVNLNLSKMGKSNIRAAVDIQTQPTTSQTNGCATPKQTKSNIEFSGFYITLCL